MFSLALAKAGPSAGLILFLLRIRTATFMKITAFTFFFACTAASDSLVLCLALRMATNMQIRESKGLARTLFLFRTHFVRKSSFFGVQQRSHTMDVYKRARRAVPHKSRDDASREVEEELLQKSLLHAAGSST